MIGRFSGELLKGELCRPAADQCSFSGWRLCLEPRPQAAAVEAPNRPFAACERSAPPKALPLANRSQARKARQAAPAGRPRSRQARRAPKRRKDAKRFSRDARGQDAQRPPGLGPRYARAKPPSAALLPLLPAIVAGRESTARCARQKFARQMASERSEDELASRLPASASPTSGARRARKQVWRLRRAAASPIAPRAELQGRAKGPELGSACGLGSPSLTTLWSEGADRLGAGP